MGIGKGRKLLADTDHIAAESRPEPAPKGGGKVRLLSLNDLDGRTRAAQRVRETRAAVMSDLGGEDQLSVLERIAVDNVAVLDGLMKDAAARWLQGEKLDVSVIATLSNTFNRTASTLGWKRRSKDITPDLQTYIRQAANGQEAA